MSDPERVERVRSSLPATQWAVDSLKPYDLRHVAEFLMGILSRAPLNGPRVRSAEAGGPSGWDAEIWVLGSLASELRLMARERGEPEPTPMHFGESPVGRARELVVEMAQMQSDREAQDERTRGRAAWLAERE